MERRSWPPPRRSRETERRLRSPRSQDLSTFAAVLYNDKVKSDRDKDKGKKKAAPKGKIKIAMGKDVDSDFGGLEGNHGGAGWRAEENHDFM